VPALVNGEFFTACAGNQVNSRLEQLTADSPESELEKVSARSGPISSTEKSLNQISRGSWISSHQVHHNAQKTACQPTS
jgi:hypothetical protein